MAKPDSNPTSLSEAIEKLESVGNGKAKDFKEHLEKDYQELRRILDNLKPQLEDLQNRVGHQFKEAKTTTEQKIKEHPWYALGLIGLVAFFVGWLIGNRKD